MKKVDINRHQREEFVISPPMTDEQRAELRSRTLARLSAAAKEMGVRHLCHKDNYLKSAKKVRGAHRNESI